MLVSKLVFIKELLPEKNLAEKNLNLVDWHSVNDEITTPILSYYKTIIPGKTITVTIPSATLFKMLEKKNWQPTSSFIKDWINKIKETIRSKFKFRLDSFVEWAEENM